MVAADPTHVAVSGHTHAVVSDHTDAVVSDHAGVAVSDRALGNRAPMAALDVSPRAGANTVHPIRTTSPKLT